MEREARQKARGAAPAAPGSQGAASSQPAAASSADTAAAYHKVRNPPALAQPKFGPRF